MKRTLVLILLLCPLAAAAQRGTIRIPTTSTIAVPMSAQICADTIFANNPGYGTLALAHPSGLCVGAIVIPVEFLGIAAWHEQGTVTISWRTTLEGSCAGFEVQRSIEPDAWSVVGTITCRGGSSEVHEYTMTDRLDLAAQTCRHLLYRVRAIDHDGRITFSPEVDVLLGDEALVPRMQAAFPNPATSRVTVRLVLPDAGTARVTIYTATGVVVATLDDLHMAAPGEQLLTIDTAPYPSGAYLVEVIAGSTRLARSFIIRR